MSYGLPYMGSKNSIADWVVSHFPKRENFYDLFCGGGAITHCALKKGMFNNYYMNDTNSTMVNGFIDCVNGKYKNESRWISHEDFDRLKGTGDLYVDLCFSFGNNYLKGYAYSRKIESFKKAVHYALFFDDYSLLNEFNIDIRLNINKSIMERYYQFKKYIKQIKGERIDLESLGRLERLQSLERLERLQSLERLHNIKINNSVLSYDEIEIKPRSLIYCDIPYFSTAKYNDNTFDYDKFYDWCEIQNDLVIISEYWMPEDRFICVDMKEKCVVLSPTNNSKKSIEKLFIPKRQINL